MVINEDTELDQALYTKDIVIEGIGSFDARKVFTPLDPRKDL